MNIAITKKFAKDVENELNLKQNSNWQLYSVRLKVAIH